MQNYDSRLAETLMLDFAQKGIPVLPVHDSFLIDKKYRQELYNSMVGVFVDNFNQTIPVSRSIPISNANPGPFLAKIVDMIASPFIDGAAVKRELNAFIEKLQSSPPKRSS